MLKTYCSALNWAASNVTDTSEIGDFHFDLSLISFLSRRGDILDRAEIIDLLLTYVFALCGRITNSLAEPVSAKLTISIRPRLVFEP